MQEDSQGVTCLHLTLQHEDILERPVLCERYTFFGGMKRIGFWEIYDGNILDFVDGENRSGFDDTKGEDVEHLWERVLFLASLWVSTFAEFRECSVSKILLDAVL